MDFTITLVTIAITLDGINSVVNYDDVINDDTVSAQSNDGQSLSNGITDAIQDLYAGIKEYEARSEPRDLEFDVVTSDKALYVSDMLRKLFDFRGKISSSSKAKVTKQKRMAVAGLKGCGLADTERRIRKRQSHVVNLLRQYDGNVATDMDRLINKVVEVGKTASDKNSCNKKRDDGECFKRNRLPEPFNSLLPVMDGLVLLENAFQIMVLQLKELDNPSNNDCELQTSNPAVSNSSYDYDENNHNDESPITT